MRTAVARVAIAVAAVLTAVGGGATARAAVFAQSGTSTAVVIVDTGGGVHQTVIHFDGAVSGLGALQLAGANPETIDYGGSLGQAVCKLYGVGDAPVPGQCPGGWTYYRAVGGANGWSQSSLGASNTTVHDGDVEGWKYSGGQPPFHSYCSVVGCAPPPTSPPATAAPAPPPQTGAPAATAGGTSAPSGAPEVTNGSGATTPSASSSTAPPAAGATVDSTTTSKPEARVDAEHVIREKQRSHNAQLAAGSGSNGDDPGGSPLGVVIALVIVAAGVVGGLWLRRRRRGPTPG
jgi:hypothetical protein